jgi:hypothetical protein
MGAGKRRRKNTLARNHKVGMIQVIRSSRYHSPQSVVERRGPKIKPAQRRLPVEVAERCCFCAIMGVWVSHRRRLSVKD